MNIFPQNPVLGQNFDYEGKTFTFIGEGWILRNKIIETDPIFQKWVNSGVLDGIVKDPDYNHTDNNLTDELVEEIEKAVQPEDLPNFGDIITHDVDEFATSEQGSKADTAYDHSQTTGNPHGTTAEQAGAAPTIHDHSVSDLSDVDGEATTVSTGDSFFLKVGNLWKTITESNFLTWLGNTFQTKLTFSTDIEADKASTTKVSAIKTMYDFFATKSEIGDINTILDSINGEVI